MSIKELEAENARLNAEVELWKLRSDNWQKFCQLTRPEMTDELNRLNAEVERLTHEVHVKNVPRPSHEA